MKQAHVLLSASIAAALASATFSLPAQTINAGNAPRITQTVDNSQLFTIPKSHLAFVAKVPTKTLLADATKMNHLQLVLKPGMAHQAEMEALIASQHDPKSTQFQHWLTPQQFGAKFGLADRDIATVTAWLTSQGFTVNNVYPNKLQIDFSGTAGQVNQAFHTSEGIYKMKDASHLANAADVSVPAALKDVVAGVMGLNDFHAKPFVKKPMVGKWDASKKAFVAKPGTFAHSGNKVIDQTIGYPDGSLRLLVPNDLATMYDIKSIRANGVTGQGITIAVVEGNDMVPGDWNSFTDAFNLTRYGGSLTQVNPAPATGPNNCVDPSVEMQGESFETVMDTEWATAIAPGAHIVVASCSSWEADYSTPTTDNFFGGVYLASANLINSNARPDIISASYGYGEFFTDPASKTAIDLMWAQADAEGISVFVSTGDSGSNPSFNGGYINGFYGNTAVDANSFATSPHVTAVGGTDLADSLDGTTSKYFAPTPSVVGGSALSYVPEIPWNQSCGNGVAAKAAGYASAVAFCQALLSFDTLGYYLTSEAGSGGPSSVDAKPDWQKLVFNAAKDNSRDLPDVALFAGAYANRTWAVICTSYYPCSPTWSENVTTFNGGTSLSAPMFAGIQALMDQGLAARGVAKDQGNAAPTLYALAATEYGGASGPAPASLAACNADNGTTGTANCVFHNVTRGSNSTQCMSRHDDFDYQTANCYTYGTLKHGQVQYGLTTTDAQPTSYGVANKAFGAQPGWSFASGLGSVDAKNLLIAWRAFANAAPAPASVASK
ncbi:S53 family peptidase [Rhodanobacter sp. L36]|uniref:S53 family peptidase n=1 Tax=Rhodanobacter sp. L36 TaxID=1747221 RepID=UPI00131B0340|nr:S53 family peptidase [Rhodanobacter sp. L36]